MRKVEDGDRYARVQFRDPDVFETIRTPDRAERAAASVAPGAEVRTGELRATGEWRTESVLIPKPVNVGTAQRLAADIVREIVK